MIDFIPVDESNLSRYVKTGLRSYNEHYLHLWKNQDASAFIEQNLTEEAVKTGLKNENQRFFIIFNDGSCAGILKLTLNDTDGNFISPQNLLLNKIYLLRKFSGQGIGKIALKFTEDFAKAHDKSHVWLLTMKKGKALHFYQGNGYSILKETKLNLPNVKPEENAMCLLAKQV